MRLATCILTLLLFAPATPWALPQVPPPSAPTASPAQLPLPQAGSPTAAPADEWPSIREALVRLPLAALLGAALALRPKRRGTPDRTPAVVETQIVLAVVGAVIMLVVGASLARAFGIVGAANLIRYRSKIEDPKDAVVMLSALAVGLASGVGLYLLAAFSTAFLVVVLWIIESFEPQVSKRFELSVKLGKDTDDRRRKIEAILARQRLRYELRSVSDEEVRYDIKAPLATDTKLVTDELLKLETEGHGAVEFTESKSKGR
jgi:uncharacterized membrane protein YhiD involved in acid resistance